MPDEPTDQQPVQDPEPAPAGDSDAKPDASAGASEAKGDDAKPTVTEKQASQREGAAAQKVRDEFKWVSELGLTRDSARKMLDADKPAGDKKPAAPDQPKTEIQQLQDRVNELTKTVQQSVRQTALTGELAEAKNWPGFTDHADAVHDNIRKQRAEGNDPDVRRAYIEVVLPNLTTKKAAREEVTAEIKKTAGASGGLRPGQPRGGSIEIKDPTKASFRDLLDNQIARNPEKYV